MRQQGDVIRGHTGLHRAHIRADLLHGAVDDGADVQPDGSVTGVADAPRHRPMEIKGQRLTAPAAK